MTTLTQVNIYNGERKVRHSILRIAPVNPNTEILEMQKIINQYIQEWNHIFLINISYP